MTSQQVIDAIGSLVAVMGNQTPSTPHPPMQIPSFYGKINESVVSWFMQIENMFILNNITDGAIQIRYAVMGFKDAALSWWLQQKISAGSNQEPYNTWDSFKVGLKSAFQPANFQQHLRVQLRKVQQKGSVQDYTIQFLNIVGQIEDMSVPDQVIQYIEGLKPAIKVELSYHAPATLTDAIDRATRYDRATWEIAKSTEFNRSLIPRSFINNNFRSSHDNNNNTRESQPTNLDILNNKRKTPYQKNKNQRFNWNKGYNSYNHNNNNSHTDNNNVNKNNNTNQQSKIQCYNCKEYGHFAKNCPQKKSQLKEH